jgi:hypothetical protein
VRAAGTLIADGDGVYSPGDFNDRLLLGLKGTMSEAEPHLILLQVASSNCGPQAPAGRRVAARRR